MVKVIFDKGMGRGYNANVTEVTNGRERSGGTKFLSKKVPLEGTDKWTKE